MADNFVDYEKIFFKRYLLDISILNLEGEEEEYQLRYQQIQKLSIENNFDNNFFPILKLRVYLPDNIYYKVNEQRNTVKFRLIIKKFEFNDLTMYEKNFYGIETFSYENIIETIMQPLITDIDENKQDISRYETLQDYNTGDMVVNYNMQNEREKPLNVLEVYLFDIDNLDTNKIKHNMIINNNSVINAIGKIMLDSNLESVLMNKIENENTYKQIIIPPYNIKKAMNYLQKSYGIFNTGLRQYLDFDTYYLLSNNINEIPIRKNEYENVIISLTRSADLENRKFGSYKDTENECYIVSTPNETYMNSSGMVNKEIIGDRNIIINKKNTTDIMQFPDRDANTFSLNSEFSTSDINNNGYQEGKNKKVSYVYDDQDNEFEINTLKYNSEEPNIEITIPFSNIDVDFFTINKKYILRFQDDAIAAKYNGNYKIKKFVYTFDNKNNENAFEVEALAEFSKWN